MTDGIPGFVFEHLREGFLLVDTEGTVVASNPAARALLGADAPLDGTDVAALPDDVRALLVGADADGPSQVTLAVDGDERTVEIDPHDVDHADAVRLVLLRDVTSRVAREREVERYETLLATLPDTVVVTDTDGRLTELHGFEGWSGYEAEELLGEPFSKTATSEAVEMSEALVAELFTDEERRKVTYEMDVVTADGERIPHENHLALLPPDEDGRIPGSMSVLRDISERKERERALEAMSEATRELVAAGSREAVVEKAVRTAREVLDLPLTGVWLVDEAGEALVPASAPDADALPAELPTFRPGESLAWEAFEAGAPRAYDDLELVERLHDPGTTIRTEIVVPLGDHGVLLSGSPDPQVLDEDQRNLAGILGAAVATALDRLDRDQEREAQRRELSRKNERLERFASVISHDLRNPLNVAHGRVKLAEKSGDVEALPGADEALERMTELIDDLLTLAREGHSIGEVTAVSLEDVAADAWASIASSDATLSIEGDVTVEADSTRLRELLENLFRNAVEHGGGAVDVRVGPLSEGDGAGFYVEDDGPGIPEDDRTSVFEHGVTGSADGTGLGLAIVEDIAEAHGWSVRVTAGSMDGARFELLTTDPADDAA